MTPIEKALGLFGSQRVMAESIGASASFVNQWARGTRPVPAKFCLKIEKTLGGAVTCEELRPDIFSDNAS